MVNRPKNIGTAAETAVVRAARRHGFPGADRLTLTGNKDRGDIGLCPGVILEVKGGKTAEQASDILVGAWLIETERERVNAGAEAALLVTKRKGIGLANADRWHAWIPAAVWADLVQAELAGITEHHRYPIRLALGDALLLLRAAGYGEPLPVDVQSVGRAREGAAT